MVDRAKLTPEDDAALKDEVSILRNLQHDHIVRIFDFYQDSRKYYLVLEICVGGELFDRIVEKVHTWAMEGKSAFEGRWGWRGM